MSKLKMLKFEAAALQKKSKTIVESLQKSGLCEINKCDDERLFTTSTAETVKQYGRYAEACLSAMSVLEAYGVGFSGGMFSGRREISGSDYETRSSNVHEIFGVCQDINSCFKQISDLDAEISRCKTLIDTLSSWSKLDVPMSGTRTESCDCFVGTLSGEHSYDGLRENISKSLPNVCEYEIEIVYTSKLITSIVVVCHKSVSTELMSYLRSVSFASPTSEMSVSDVGEKLRELDSKIIECTKLKKAAEDSILSHRDLADDIKFAYDYFVVKGDEYEALSSIGFSDSTIYISGYTAEVSKDKVKKIIEKCGGAVVFTEPCEEDDVPVILKNGAFSEPVEGIVEMYATPGKSDIDPSKVMAFFYYLLFGMMLSDAGYGLIMALGTALILKFTSVEGNMRKTLKMFFFCGISTVFWGALFGSWFGDIIPVICREFLGIANPPSVALWFEPIEDPITLLLFSFVIGIAHLFLGLFTLMYMKWKEGDKVGAIFDTVPIMLTVLGAAPLAGSILAPVPAFIQNIAKYLAIAGVVLIVLTNSRSSKNILARLGGGLYGLYNIASGYLSDILSYSRLLALGLATGSIASVVNMLGVMPQNMVMKTVVFIIVFIVGHSLNMAINVLGAYVHTNRLQFVELFSKFYEGGGKAFSPFKLNTKYYKLKEENKND